MDKPWRPYFQIDVEEAVRGFEKIQKILKPYKKAHNPPSNQQEFEDRLKIVEQIARDDVFGSPYEDEKRKIRRRETSTKALVEALCQDAKRPRESFSPSLGQLEPYKYLKLVLEKNARLHLPDEIDLLGVRRDCSGPSVPQKNEIAVQAIAQVLWYLEKVPTKVEMSKILLNKKGPFYELLNRKFNSRVIENWIRKVCPMQENLKGRRAKIPKFEDSCFDNLIPIPGIFLEDGKVINFPKLKFAIKCLTRVLNTLKWPLNLIKESNFISLYQKPVPFYLHRFINDWIDEAFAENGRIFDQ